MQHKKNKKKKRSQLPFRLNFLFFIVFLLFSALILRLGVIQIVYGEDYKREIEKTEEVVVNNPVPRGKIFDRNGNLVVGNIPKNAITYTNYGASQKEMLEVAERLAKLIEVKPDKVQERDKKDYWIIKNRERAAEKVSEKEKKKLQEKYEGEKEKYDKKVYQLQLERITEEDLKELTDQDLEIIAIYRTFSSGYAYTSQIVKNEDVTDEEIAKVSENLRYLPGVDTTTDWDRSYFYEGTLKTVLGKVTDTNEGLPLEKLDYYLARDYSRNDRVGKSYLEMQYEDVLHGQKAKVKNITDKAGNVLETEVVSEGKRGNDLVLTIDMDLQLEVEKIIEEELRKGKSQPRAHLLDRAFVVLMDPNTGEVLTMAGKQITKDEETGKTKIQDFALGNITTSYNMGSAVKGATILTGYKTGAISPGTVQYDAPIRIKGTPEKSSWKNFGSLNDIRALRVSSNVYMFKTAIAIGKGNYQPGQPLSVDPKAFNTIRDSFAQFGLGIRTGIDLPNESVGFKGMSTSPGFLLDLSIGQYDTYTPMQLAQYVCTIANGGYRMKPRIVKEIRAPLENSEEIGPVVEEITPTVLNRIDLKDGWIERVQEGFRQVTQHSEGTAYSRFVGAKYSPAGKTGTAEAFYDGPERYKYDEPPEVKNLTFVGYAPHNNPEVAIAVVVPWAYQGRSGYGMNTIIARRVLDTYFDMKEKRQNVNKIDESNEQQLDEPMEENE